MCPSELEPEVKPETEDPIKTLRDEFAEQFAALKKSFEETNAAKDAEIAKLKEDNDSLHRALIRSAVNEPPQNPEPEKSEEDIYFEEVNKIANKTIEFMKLIG